MKRVGVLSAVVAAAWLVAPPVCTAGAAAGAKSAPFAAVRQMETELRRGVSVKADVRKLLGEAGGSGECFLPGQSEPREVWFYEDMVVTGYRRSGGAYQMDMRQQILLVFFKGDSFDGYLWTSNALPAVIEE